ncbi:uracil-DNA glycosylase family protein [Gluconobacter wancherniae]|uniref:hypothetical protein n=1 Tax=Gluconobacter wancherniae TaxID=1307955 RepID=UPI001B8CEAE6|nr:hypothetical protein [Gluconobacter wancherniae]MBS1087756.1 hypothetical protein [Gluconobacter wancherniae]
MTFASPPETVVTTDDDANGEASFISPGSVVEKKIPVLGTEPVATESLGPLSAELLVVGLDSTFATHFTEMDIIQDAGITFDTAPDEALISARLTYALTSDAPDTILLPEDFEIRATKLSAEVRNMHNLKLVLVLGVSAHVAVLEACGIPLTRMDYRPGNITRLPDGLLIADGSHLSSTNIENTLGKERLAALAALIVNVRNALRPNG